MMSMAVADLLGASFWFADIMYSICPYFMLINLYGYQSAQMWSCVIGAYLVLKFSQRTLPNELAFHIIAWGFPIISQVIIITRRLYREFPPPQGCWLEFGQMEMLVVAIPQGITVLLNSAFLAIIFIHQGSTYTRWGFRNRDKSLLYIQICCLLTTFAAVLQSIPAAPEIVYQISFILGASQGLFNALSMRQRFVLKFLLFGTKRISGLLHQGAPTSGRNIAVTTDDKQEEPGPSATLLDKASNSIIRSDIN